MDLKHNNEQEVGLTFHEPLEADLLRKSIAPAIGRLARLKLRIEIERAMSNSNRPPIEVTVAKSKLPEVMSSLDARVKDSSRTSALDAQRPDFTDGMGAQVVEAQMDTKMMVQAREQIAKVFSDPNSHPPLTP